MSNIILRSVTSLPDAPVGYKFILNDGGVLKQKELSVISGFKGGLPYKVISGTFIKQTNGLAVVTITTNTWGSYSIQQLPGPGTRGVPASSQYRFLLGSPQNKTICFVSDYIATGPNYNNLSTEVNKDGLPARVKEYQPGLFFEGDAVVLNTYSSLGIGAFPGGGVSWPIPIPFEIRVYE